MAHDVEIVGTTESLQNRQNKPVFIERREIWNNNANLSRALPSQISRGSTVCGGEILPTYHEFDQILQFGGHFTDHGQNFHENEPVVYSTVRNFTLVGIYCHPCVRETANLIIF